MELYGTVVWGDLEFSDRLNIHYEMYVKDLVEREEWDRSRVCAENPRTKIYLNYTHDSKTLTKLYIEIAKYENSITLSSRYGKNISGKMQWLEGADLYEGGIEEIKEEIELRFRSFNYPIPKQMKKVMKCIEHILSERFIRQERKIGDSTVLILGIPEDRPMIQIENQYGQFNIHPCQLDPTHLFNITRQDKIGMTHETTDYNTVDLLKAGVCLCAFLAECKGGKKVVRLVSDMLLGGW